MLKVLLLGRGYRHIQGEWDGNGAWFVIRN
jgi:hypothetical protein